jgi:hypothetical protein
MPARYAAFAEASTVELDGYCFGSIAEQTMNPRTRTERPKAQGKGPERPVSHENYPTASRFSIASFRPSLIGMSGQFFSSRCQSAGDAAGGNQKTEDRRRKDRLLLSVF